MPHPWDAIVVGARCAGAPTAMLLARKGYRVLLLDRATFPSDTISTHLLHPPAVADLERWGLLDGLRATACPPIGRYTFDFGPFAISAPPAPNPEQVAYCPRRTVLDSLLVDAAAEAGAEVREGFVVDEVVFEDGRVTGVRGRAGDAAVAEAARVVIGADGQHSVVAQAVGAQTYHERPPVQASYYTYFSDLPTDGFEVFVRHHRAWAAMPTHDGLTVVIAGWPIAEFERNRRDIEGHYRRAFEQEPAFAARVRAARREARFAGMRVAGYFRRPFGPGWALVGDAGYNKDFITAMGILDAFRDAELCSTAIDEAFVGRSTFDEAMGAYQRRRDEQALPMYEFTYQFAPLQPPPPEMQLLLGATARDAAATTGFVRMNAGLVSPADFFSERNVQRILSANGSRAP